jgi:phosphoribosylanthranilate isomerase
VGVFVNETAAFARELGHELGLDLLQLHGDETPDFLLQLVGRPLMRAFRLGYTGLEAVEAYLDHCRQRACLPRLVLLDALVEGEYGGTGQTTDWEAAARFATTHAMPGLVLAGGLTPENVAAAIHAVHPAAVDTASGVELSPGRKDHARMAAFIRAARHEFARLFAMEEGIGD